MRLGYLAVATAAAWVAPPAGAPAQQTLKPVPERTSPSAQEEENKVWSWCQAGAVPGSGTVVWAAASTGAAVAEVGASSHERIRMAKQMKAMINMSWFLSGPWPCPIRIVR